MRPDPQARQEGLVDHGEELGEEYPKVYLAMPLSQLDEDKRDKVELLADSVNQAIYETTRRGSEPWPVRVHSPVKHSAPWKDDPRTPEEIYRLNTDAIWGDVDAMIVIAEPGGGIGVGQELAWACQLGLPVLVVHKKGTCLSRQVTGTREEHDVTIETYRDPEHLRDVLDRWLLARQATICDGPRRRVGRLVRYTSLCDRLGKAWTALSAGEREHVVATTRIAPVRIARILADPLALAAASTEERAALGSALRIDGGSRPASRGLPQLEPKQRAALNSAAREFDWNFETSLRLYENARRELAAGGIRRLPLASNRDWAEFAERHDD